MQWQQAIVRVWDGLPHRNGKFIGTAFFINSNTLLTAKHVVEGCVNNVYIDGVPLGGKEKIEANKIYFCNRDIAILQTSRTFPSIVSLCLNKAELNYGQKVTLNGYFDEYQSLNIIESEIAGHVSYIHAWRTQGSIGRGMSGGPVVLNNDNNLIGMLNARDADKNLTYLIPTDVILDCLQQYGIQVKTHIASTYNVPSLPKHYIQLDEHLDCIRELLLKSQIKSVGITSISQAVGLYGMGGIGKSVLATAIANDNQIQSAFNDGIIWIRLGQAGDIGNIVNAQTYILECLGKLVKIPENPRQGKALLNKLLVDKKILLILDDIWDIEQARAFEIYTTSSKLLITTRNARVLSAMDAEEYQINVLSNEHALRLLRNQSECTEGAMPEEAEQIVKECGFLPLAISMVGAMLRNRPHNRWKRALKHLREADLKKIRHPIRNYEHADLFKALHVSVESLQTRIQKCYLSLAVFPKDIPIPESVLAIYWDQDDLQYYDATEIIDELLDASLLFQYQEDSVIPHELQRDYLLLQSTNIKQLHEKMINAYAKAYPGGWHTIPLTHPYYFHNHFDFHLNQIENKILAKAIAEDLLARQPFLNWPRAMKCGQLTNKSKKQIANQLIKTSKSSETLVVCLKLLGFKAKGEARSLLKKENQNPNVISACLRLLGEEAKDKARRLLKKENQNPDVISVCLRLLGEEAKEDARRLLKEEHQNLDVIVACLKLLGEEVKDKARLLLKKENQYPDVIKACLRLLGEEAKNESRLLLKKENQNPDVISACLRLLGEEVKDKARRLLKKENQYPDVIKACLRLLGEEAKNEARRLLKKEHQYPDVISACLRLLGEEAKNEARLLLKKENQYPDVIKACLRLLGEEAKNEARLLLKKENQYPDIVRACLKILGKDAANYALETLTSPKWYQLDSHMKALVLKIPLNNPIREKLALEIISRWRFYFRPLVTSALMVFNKYPEKVMVCCQEIITQWEREITYYIQKGIPKYSFHINKALRHPGLADVAKQAALEMQLKEKEQPSFLDEELRELVEKISNRETLPWDSDSDEINAGEIPTELELDKES